MLKKVLFGLALVLATTGVANAGSAGKVLVCHATSSEKNPVVMISVSENALEAQLAIGSTLPRLLEDGTYTCSVEVLPE